MKAEIKQKKSSATTTINLGSVRHMDCLSEMAEAQKIPVTLPAFLRWLIEKEYKTFKNGK